MSRARIAVRLALPPLVGAGLLLVLPSPVFADNCSGLSDCWSTAAGAASAAAGAAVGAIGGLFGGLGGNAGGSDGGFSGRGATGTWPAPGAPSAPAPDHYPFPGPGEPGGEQEARQRVRDYYRDVRSGKRPPRTSEDAMGDLESLLPKAQLDFDEGQRKYWEDWEAGHGTDRAERG